MSLLKVGRQAKGLAALAKVGRGCHRVLIVIVLRDFLKWSRMDERTIAFILKNDLHCVLQ